MSYEYNWNNYFICIHFGVYNFSFDINIKYER